MTQSNCMLICRFFFFSFFQTQLILLPWDSSFLRGLSSCFHLAVYHLLMTMFPTKTCGHSQHRRFYRTSPCHLSQMLRRYRASSTAEGFLQMDLSVCRILDLCASLISSGRGAGPFCFFFCACKWGRDCGYIVLVGRSVCVQICTCVLLTAMLEQWLCDSYTAHLANGKQHFTLFF